MYNVAYYIPSKDLHTSHCLLLRIAESFKLFGFFFLFFFCYRCRCCWLCVNVFAPMHRDQNVSCFTFECLRKEKILKMHIKRVSQQHIKLDILLRRKQHQGNQYQVPSGSVCVWNWLFVRLLLLYSCIRFSNYHFQEKNT